MNVEIKMYFVLFHWVFHFWF